MRFNHDQFGDPNGAGGDYLDTSNPAGFGSLPGSVTSPNNGQGYTRQMQFGVRINF
jgi:hypothetical protein